MLAGISDRFFDFADRRDTSALLVPVPVEGELLLPVSLVGPGP